LRKLVPSNFSDYFVEELTHRLRENEHWQTIKLAVSRIHQHITTCGHRITSNIKFPFNVRTIYLKITTGNRYTKTIPKYLISSTRATSPPAPLYLRTLWRYTNAVIIIIIIIIIKSIF